MKPGVLALALLGAACTPPDRWSVLQPEWEGRGEGDRDVVPPAPAPPPPQIDWSANGPVELSVEDALMVALHGNRDLRVQQLEPVIAGTFEQLERGVFDPEVFAELGYFREKATETARATGEQFDVAGRETAAVAGVRQFLPTGTTVEATVSQERSISNRTPEQQTARVGLTVTQALLRGLGPAVNLAAVEQARLEHVASVHELRRFVEVVLADTKVAYWYYVLAAESIAIFEESLDVARRQSDEVEQRIAVGVLPETEAAAMRAEVALREQALIDARSLLEERRLRLLRLLGASEYDRPILPVSEPRVEAEPVADLTERLELARAMRADLNEARVRLEQGRLETIVTEDGLLPRLDFFVAVGGTGFADTFDRSFGEIDGGTYDLAVGLEFSHFVGNRSARAANRAAWASREQARQAVANLEEIVGYDVRLAANEVERARQQIAASRATRELQERTLEAERQRFDVGTSTALLVAQAQRDLLESRIAEVEAVVNYRIALVRLHLAEGSLLDRHGIVLYGAAPK